MFNPLPLLAVLSLFSTAQAAPSSISPSAAIQLATGSSMSTGQITPTFMWQSSGQLSSGPCPFTVKITDCYTMKLSSSGNLASRAFGHHYQNFDETSDPLEFTPILEEEEDDSAAVSRGVAHALLPRAADTNATTNSTTPVPTPRQRIEMLSWPPAPAGTSWRYQWRTFLQRGASTSNQFFHLMQLLRRVDGGGAVVTLTAKAGNVGIYDVVRGCSNCVSIPLTKIIGRTLQHNITVTYGQNGTLVYEMRDAILGTTLLRYRALGEMGSQSSLKFGAYRATYAGMSSITNYVGDYSAEAVRLATSQPTPSAV